MGTATFLGAQGRFRDPKPNSAVPRRRRQRLPAESSPLARRRGGASPTSSPANKNLVMGQVKILKRGEPLVPAAATALRRKPDADLALGSTDRLGPDPELVSFQIRVKELKMAVDGTYAGVLKEEVWRVNRDRWISLLGEDGLDAAVYLPVKARSRTGRERRKISEKEWKVFCFVLWNARN